MEDEDEELLFAAAPQPLPTLEDLCLDVLAAHIESVDVHVLAHVTLPYGGGARLVDKLLSSGRLRADMLASLLRTPGVESLSSQLGGPLASAAPGCRGLAALATARLAFAHSGAAGGAGLPGGTRSSSGASAAAASAR